MLNKKLLIIAFLSSMCVCLQATEPEKLPWQRINNEDSIVNLLGQENNGDQENMQAFMQTPVLPLEHTIEFEVEDIDSEVTDQENASSSNDEENVQAFMQTEVLDLQDVVSEHGDTLEDIFHQSEEEN